MNPALQVDRYADLCRTVAIFLKPDDALDVLSLMALAAPVMPEPAPVERAISRLGSILDLDLTPASPARPFDQATA